MDYVAASFPRYGSDIQEARKLVQATGSKAWIIAKIERAEAVADDRALDAIIKVSDGVMVARGDLGVEVGDARRSEERRVGQGCVSTCRFRWWPSLSKKKKR